MDSAGRSKGCPIRKFPDQSVFPAPRDLSQVTTSFIASVCQGIHREPFVAWPLISKTLAVVETDSESFKIEWFIRLSIARHNRKNVMESRLLLKNWHHSIKEWCIHERCFILTDFSYAVVKVLLDIKLIIQFEPSILSTKNCDFSHFFGMTGSWDHASGHI